MSNANDLSLRGRSPPRIAPLCSLDAIKAPGKMTLPMQGLEVDAMKDPGKRLRAVQDIIFGDQSGSAYPHNWLPTGASPVSPKEPWSSPMLPKEHVQPTLDLHPLCDISFCDMEMSSKKQTLHLAPSAAPTPRLRSSSKPMLYGSFVLGRACITLPSANPSNDFARIRNGGKPLQPRPALAELGQGLLHVASAPALFSGGGSPSNGAGVADASSSFSPKTPRSIRGMVRRVSKVACSVPAAYRVPPPPPGLARKSERVSRSESEPDRLKKSPSNKRVSFGEPEDSEWSERFEPIAKEGVETTSKKKNKRLLGSLHDLRRVDVASSPSNATIAPEAAGSFSTEEKATALLHTTLGELFDSEASLRMLEEQLADAYDGVTAVGGGRHATAILSARSLAVVRRKATLLHAVEARFVSFQAAHTKRDELIQQMMSGDVKEPPADLTGIPKFISQHTHKSASGSPVDADKSDFEAFASSFKLPARHHQLERLHTLSVQVSQWWAEASLRVAEEGANYEQIRRLFAVSTGAGAEEDHPYLLRATKILNDRLADKVLKDAQEKQQRDTDAFQRTEQAGTIPQVGMATRAADAIEQALFEVIAEGVSSNDPRLIKVRDICKTLREADGQRKRLAARQQRLAEKTAAQKRT